MSRQDGAATVSSLATANLHKEPKSADEAARSPTAPWWHWQDSRLRVEILFLRCAHGVARLQSR